MLSHSPHVMKHVNYENYNANMNTTQQGKDLKEKKEK